MRPIDIKPLVLQIGKIGGCGKVFLVDVIKSGTDSQLYLFLGQEKSARQPIENGSVIMYIYYYIITRKNYLHSKNSWGTFMKLSTAVEAVNKILTGKNNDTDWAKGGAIAIFQKRKL